MTDRRLKTSTAGLLVLSLIQPVPAMAQIQMPRPGAVSAANPDVIRAQATDLSCFTNGQVDMARCDVEMLRAELEVLLQDGLPDPTTRPPEDEATAALTAEDRIGLLSAAIENAEREAMVAQEEEAQLAQAETDQTEADAAANLQAEIEAAAEAEAAAAQAEADAAAQAEADAAAQIEADAAAQIEADAAAQAEADAAAQEEADAAAQAEADAAAQAEADAAAQAEADAAAQEEADAAAQAEADAAAQAEADAAAQAEADAAAQAEADAATADETEQSSFAQAIEQSAEEEAAQAEADAAALAEVEAAAAAEAERAAAEEEAARAAMNEAERAAAEQAEADAAALQERLAAEEAEASAQRDAEIAAEQEAAQSLAAVTATPENDGNAAAQTTTEVVTQDESRSSAEEFVSAITAQSDARPRDESSGLSSLEKGGLLALGALAVGALIQNNQRVAATSGDRVIIEDDAGRFQVLKDDDAVLRQPGSTVETRRFDDGSTTSTVSREDGSQVVTIRDAQGRVLRRSVFDANGNESLLIDDISRAEPVNVATLPRAPQQRAAIGDRTDRAALRAALRAAEARDIGRSFSLRQVRDIVEVRELAPQIALEDVTFQTGSAAIQPSEAENLREIGLLMRDLIRDNPREVFLIEGYTDAVGRPAFNLLLSDRRAESVALALTEYFDVPPENMVVQGYGARFLKVPTLEAERQNRRVAVRRITSLIAQR